MCIKFNLWVLRKLHAIFYMLKLTEKSYGYNFDFTGKDYGGNWIWLCKTLVNICAHMHLHLFNISLWFILGGFFLFFLTQKKSSPLSSVENALAVVPITSFSVIIIIIKKEIGQVRGCYTHNQRSSADFTISVQKEDVDTSGHERVQEGKHRNGDEELCRGWVVSNEIKAVPPHSFTCRGLEGHLVQPENTEEQEQFFWIPPKTQKGGTWKTI